jgi:hypothetical protein
VLGVTFIEYISIGIDLLLHVSVWYVYNTAESSKCEENDSRSKIDCNILYDELVEPPQTKQGSNVLLLCCKSLVVSNLHAGSGINTMLDIKALEVLGRGGRKVRVLESIGSYVESSIAALAKGYSMSN